MLKLVHCSFEQHAQAILSIFNEVIQNSTALYETEERDLSKIKLWFREKEELNFPVLGFENDHKELLGFVTYGRYRPQPATIKTVEHSLYIDKNSRGQKVGEKLLIEYLKHIKEQGFHTSIAAIDSENIPCIKLHEKLRFKCCGKIIHAARKFDRWLDLELYQILLEDN